MKGWAIAALLMGAGLAAAQTPAPSPTPSPTPPARRSGFDDMRASTQALQRDDAQNPAMLWVADGEALFARSPASSGAPACLACHATASLRGVAARYPAFDAALERPVSLAHRINLCRQRHQREAPLAFESAPLLALEAYVAHASRGQPIAPPADARLAPFQARGQAIYHQRIGQINLSCANCHDERAGRKLGGNPIVQGHPTGYPIYRLEWQTLGSLERRLRACMTAVRAEPLAPYDQDMAALQVFLMRRAAGMPLETPAVRP